MTVWSVRWEVTDVDGNPVGSLTGDGGSIGWDGRSTVQRTARDVRFPRAEWAQVNPLTDLLAAVAVDEAGNTTRLGLFFVLDDATRVLSDDVVAPPVPVLADSGVLLDTESPYTMSARVGETLGDAIARVCDAAGVTRRMIDPAGDLVGEPIAWPVGTRYTAALASLCQLAGFLPAHFDRDGVLILRAPPPPDAAPDVTYTSADVIAATRVVSNDLLTAPNTFVVVGAGATGGPIVAVAEVDPGLPHSVQNRNRRVVQTIREQGVDTVDQAERLASLVALTASQQATTVTFSTVPSAAHDCFTLVEVDGVLYQEASWVLPLDGTQPMGHEVATISGVSR